MPLYKPSVPAHYALLLIDHVRERAPEHLPAVLAVTARDEASLRHRYATLDMEHFDALVCLAAERLQRSDLGLVIGRQITLESHGALGQLLSRCTTADQLFRLAERYYRIVTPAFVARYQWAERLCTWTVRLAAPMSPTTLRLSLELQAISQHADLFRLLGADLRGEIHLSFPRPRHAEFTKALAPLRVHFNSGNLPELRFVLPAEVVCAQRRPVRLPATPSPLPELAQLDQEKAAFPSMRHCGAWVETLLREANGVQPGLAELAELLDISPRSLSRRLREEGINLRELSGRIRHERARTLLLDRTLSLEQIAGQLGYNDVPAFSRAFQKYAGQPPAGWRNSQRATF